MEEALSEVLGLCVLLHGYSLVRIPRPTGPWETGQAITHMGQAEEKWQSFSQESKYDCL